MIDAHRLLQVQTLKEQNPAHVFAFSHIPPYIYRSGHLGCPSLPRLHDGLTTVVCQS